MERGPKKRLKIDYCETFNRNVTSRCRANRAAPQKETSPLLFGSLRPSFSHVATTHLSHLSVALAAPWRSDTCSSRQTARVQSRVLSSRLPRAAGTPRGASFFMVTSRPRAALQPRH